MVSVGGRKLISRTSRVSRYGKRSKMTTIPLPIAEILGVRSGDILKWTTIQIDRDIVVVVEGREADTNSRRYG